MKDTNSKTKLVNRTDINVNQNGVETEAQLVVTYFRVRKSYET